MLLHFRQGIVEAQIPTFFRVTYPSVDLVVTDTNTTIAFAAGEKDYLYTEQISVANAWGPLYLGIDQWLYWDLDIRTGNRTFGITTVEPVVAAVAPIAPATDQHWFDTSANEMKVWSGNVWIKKIRTFAFKLSQGRVPVSMSSNSPSFVGTQVGNTSTTYAGHILYDATTNNAIKNAYGQFMTTEDKMSTKAISLSQVKLAGIIVEGEAQQNLAAHTVVTFTEFGKIVHADQFVAEQPIQFGIIEQNAVVGQVVNVVTSGMISSQAFDFSGVGVNTLLYSDANGQLVDTPVIPNQHPVAIVVDRKTIQLGVAIAAADNQAAGVDLATNIKFGISRLSVPAEDEQDPIVVGDNDPRLTNARPPQFHTHTIPQVVNLQQELDNRVLRAGDTMTGALILHGAPTQAQEAATKQYVDDSRTPAAGSSYQVQYNVDNHFAASNSLALMMPTAPYDRTVLNVGAADSAFTTITTSSSNGNLQIEAGGRQDAQPGTAILQGGELITTVEPAGGLGTIFGGHAMVVGGPGRGEFGRAGDAWIQGGAGGWMNGRVIIDGGTNFDNTLGRSTTHGGSVQITGGHAQGATCTYNGGGVVISGGRAEGSGTPGSVEIHTNETHRVSIGQYGEWQLGATFDTGSNGTVLTSRGPNQPPVWTTPTAGVTDRIVNGDAMVRVTNNVEVPPRVDTYLGQHVIVESTEKTTIYHDYSIPYWASTVTHDFPSDQNSIISSVAYDNQGCVYVGTVDDNNGTSSILQKFNTDGTIAWSYNINSNLPDYSNCAVTVGPNSVFVLVAGGQWDSILFEFSLNGAFQRSVKLGDIAQATPGWTGSLTCITYDDASGYLYLGGSSYFTELPLVVALDPAQNLQKVIEFEVANDMYVDQGGNVQGIKILSNGTIACFGETWDNTSVEPPSTFLAVVNSTGTNRLWCMRQQYNLTAQTFVTYTGIEQCNNMLVAVTSVDAGNGSYKGRDSFGCAAVEVYNMVTGDLIHQTLISSPTVTNNITSGGVAADVTNPSQCYIGMSEYDIATGNKNAFHVLKFDTNTASQVWCNTYKHNEALYSKSGWSDSLRVRGDRLIAAFTCMSFSTTTYIEKPVVMSAPITADTISMGSVNVTNVFTPIIESAFNWLSQIVPTAYATAVLALDEISSSLFPAVLMDTGVSAAEVGQFSYGHVVEIQGPVAPRQIIADGSIGRANYLLGHNGAGPAWVPEFYSTYCDLLEKGDIRAEHEWPSCFLHVEDGFTQFIDVSAAADNGMLVPYNFVLPTGLDATRRHCFRLLIIDNYSNVYWKVFENGENQQVDYSVVWLDGNQLLNPGGRWKLYEMFTLNGGDTWFCSMIPGGSFD